MLASVTEALQIYRDLVVADAKKAIGEASEKALKSLADQAAAWEKANEVLGASILTLADITARGGGISAWFVDRKNTEYAMRSSGGNVGEFVAAVQRNGSTSGVSRVNLPADSACEVIVMVRLVGEKKAGGKQ